MPMSSSTLDSKNNTQ